MGLNVNKILPIGRPDKGLKKVTSSLSDKIIWYDVCLKMDDRCQNNLSKSEILILDICSVEADLTSPLSNLILNMIAKYFCLN
jgi:hypothetical protein